MSDGDTTKKTGRQYRFAVIYAVFTKGQMVESQGFSDSLDGAWRKADALTASRGFRHVVVLSDGCSAWRGFLLGQPMFFQRPYIQENRSLEAQP